MPKLKSPRKTYEGVPQLTGEIPFQPTYYDSEGEQLTEEDFQQGWMGVSALERLCGVVKITPPIENPEVQVHTSCSGDVTIHCKTPLQFALRDSFLEVYTLIGEEKNGEKTFTPKNGNPDYSIELKLNSGAKRTPLMVYFQTPHEDDPMTVKIEYRK